MGLRTPSRSTLGWLCGAALIVGSCSAAKREPASSAPMMTLKYKRVGKWQYGKLGEPPSAVETQLKRHFEVFFEHAQFSAALTCVARERARFYARYEAAPDELLDAQMLARCGTPSNAATRIITAYSDGTLLDRPLSSTLLAELDAKLGTTLPPFLTFGVTALDAGPTVILSFAFGSPVASMHVDSDSSGEVRVRGRVIGDVVAMQGIISQGELGTAPCEADPDLVLPEYALSCRLAEGDEAAWLEVGAQRALSTGTRPQMGEEWLGALLVRRPGAAPPAQYRRATVVLPAKDDALVDYINHLRRKAGVRPLAIEHEESKRIGADAQRLFESLAADDTVLPRELVADLTSGRRVGGPVWWAQMLTGLAVEGDAGAWLTARLRSPHARSALLAPGVDRIALAEQHDAVIGFGATAVVYSLLTPEREQELAEQIVQQISRLRGDAPTRRAASDEAFSSASKAVAAGQARPQDAFRAALARTKVGVQAGRDVRGVFLELPWDPLDFELPPALLTPHELVLDVVTTHDREPGADWFHPVAFVWFLQDDSDMQEARAQPLGQPSAGVRAL